jgi:hypothetical protein
VHQVASPTEGTKSAETVAWTQLNRGESHSEERAEQVITRTRDIRAPLVIELSNTVALAEDHWNNSEPGRLADLSHKV